MSYSAALNSLAFAWDSARLNVLEGTCAAARSLRLALVALSDFSPVAWMGSLVFLAA